MTNIRKMMSKAHEMTRAARQERPGIDYRTTLAEALRLLWYDARGGARAEWAAMSGQEQAETLTRMVWAAKKREMALDRWAAAVEWILTPDDAAAVVAEAWILLEDSGIDRATAQGRTLAGAMYGAVVSAAQKIDRAERRHASALRYDEQPGEEYDAARAYVIDHAAPLAEPIAPAPEVYALTIDELETAAADHTDRQIMTLILAGFSQQETADRLDLSQPAVAQRLRKIRDRHAVYTRV